MRRVQERRNSDMYSVWVHGPPRCGGRQDARARRVGGGQGDGGYHAPTGGRFVGRAPGRPQYGYGPRDRGFGGSYDAPRFPSDGGRQHRGRWDRENAFTNFANPSVEPMARH